MIEVLIQLLVQLLADLLVQLLLVVMVQQRIALLALATIYIERVQIFGDVLLLQIAPVHPVLDRRFARETRQVQTVFRVVIELRAGPLIIERDLLLVRQVVVKQQRGDREFQLVIGVLEILVDCGLLLQQLEGLGKGEGLGSFFGFKLFWIQTNEFW